jgi:hypothetical protein
LIPDAALTARQILAQQLRIDFNAIQFVSVEQVEWPDACLGVPIPDALCATVVTPGYRVVLEVEGRRFEYHTNDSGSDVRLAAAPDPEIDNVAIVWEQADLLCNTAIIGDGKVAFGVCRGPLMTGLLIPEMERPEQLADFVETYASFEADTPAGAVKFTGQGSTIATEAEQRMIAEWARLVALEAAGGRSGASYGLAVAWHREGGIARFCDDLSVYVTGDVFAASCAGSQPVDRGRARLSADRLAQLFEWMDGLKNFEFEQSDGAVADSMTIRVVFTGFGQVEASDSDRQAIQDFAAQLFAELSQ